MAVAITAARIVEGAASVNELRVDGARRLVVRGPADRGRPHPARAAGRRRGAAGRPARGLERPHPGARVRRRRLVRARRRACGSRPGPTSASTASTSEPARRSRSRSRRTRSSPEPCATPTPTSARTARGSSACGSGTTATAPRRSTRSSCCRPRPARTSASRSSRSCSSPGPTSWRRPASAPTARAWRGSSGTTRTCRGTAPSCAGPPFDPEGGAADGERVAGGPDESVIQPTWTAAAGCSPSSDRTGWWNVYRFTGGDLVLDDPEPLTPDRRRDRRPALGLRPVVRSRCCPTTPWWSSLGADGLAGGGRGRTGHRPGRAARHAVHGRRPAPRGRRRRVRVVAAGADPRGDAVALPLRGRGRARDRGAPARRGTSGSTRRRSRVPEPIKFPTTRRPHRARAALPADQPGGHGAARRAAAAARAEPRRADRGGPPDPQPRHPVLDQPGLRGRRRQLRRQHRLRPGLPRAARRPWGIVDVDDCVAAAGTSRPRDWSTPSGSPSGAAAPAATRRCARWPSATRSPPAPATTASPTRGPRPRHPQVRVALPRRPGRAVPEPRSTSTWSARRSTTPTASPAR